MTKKELKIVRSVLERVKPLDGHVSQALALIAKDIAAYDARKGQLLDQYDYDDRHRLTEGWGA